MRDSLAHVLQPALIVVLTLLCLGLPAQSPGAAIAAEAQRQFQQGRFDLALEAWRKSYELEPRNETAYWMAIAAIQMGQVADAERWLLQAVTDPNARGAWFQALGKCQLDLGRPLAARESLGRAISIGPRTDPNFAVWYCNRALCSLEAGEIKASIPDLEEAVKLKPDYAQAWYQLGQARADTGDNTGALRALETTLSLDATNIEARFLLGRCQLSSGAVEASIGNFNTVLQNISGHVGALWNLSQALQKLKRKEEAKKVLERFKTMSALTERIEYTETAVKINPGNAPLKNELVLLLLQAGRARDAMKHLDELRRTAPSSTVYMNMAKALRMMGARAEADQAEAMAARLLREGH